MERNESWKCLATAIAIQAVKDYRKAMGQLKLNPHCYSAILTIKEVKRFFSSEWYQTLCQLNPGIIGIADKEGIAV
jgi:hypothetical protein